MEITLIAAMEPSQGIGRDGSIPWHLPADLKRFRSLTKGKTLVMGRKTHESILKSLGKPLGNERITIVVTKQPNYKVPDKCIVVHDPIKALEYAFENKKDELIVAGGASLYSAYLPFATTMQFTLVWHRFLCDTFFPKFDLQGWSLVERNFYLPDKKNLYPYTFLTLKRKLIDMQTLFS